MTTPAVGHVAALGRAARELLRRDDPRAMIAAVATEAMQALDAVGAAAFLREGPTSEVRYVPVHCPDAQAGEALAAWVAATADTWSRRECAIHVAAERVVLPLSFGDAAIGAVALAHDRPREYSEPDVQLATALAAQASLAIGRNLLFEQVSGIKREWQAAFDALHSGIAVVDAAGTILRANRFVAGLAGVPVTGIAGLRLAEVMPAWPGAGSDPVALALRNEAAASALAEWPPSRYLLVSATPMGDGRLVVTIDDVTAEHQAAAALQRSEARFRAVFDSAPLAIATIGSSGEFLAANPAALALGGLAAPATGMRLQDFLHPADRDYVGIELAGILKAPPGQPREFMLRIRRQDGLPRDTAIVAVPIERRGGPAVLAIARDVTDEQALRDRVIHAEKMAAIGRLVSGVAHELNNPLAGIMALAQTLIGDAPDEGTQRVLETIRREASRAGRIVSDLLAFGRQQPVDRRETDLEAVVRQALELHVEVTGRGGAQWQLDFAANLPTFGADPDQLRQVVSNLLANAEFAMRGVPGAVGCIRTWTRDGVIGCEVADAGTGIPPEVLVRIFDPFFTTKAVGEGTGLGLSLAHGIIRAHGGEIRAENRPVGGARVWFEIPRVPARPSR